MPIDSRNKRASALACGLAFLAVLPAPDGLALDQGDRQQTAAVYRGVVAGVPVVHFPAVLALQGADGGRLSVVGGDGLTLTVEAGG